MSEDTFDVVFVGGTHFLTVASSTNFKRAILRRSHGLCRCRSSRRRRPSSESFGKCCTKWASTEGTNDLQILEAGPHTRDVKQHVQPAKNLTHLIPNSRTVTFNQAKPSPSLLGRAPIVLCGHAVGGGSSINCKCSWISQKDLLTRFKLWSTPELLVRTTMTGRTYMVIKGGDRIS